MTDVAKIVDNYIAIWNETDPDRRRALVAETWTENATYLDPLLSGEGASGIDSMVASAQSAYPGHRFELSSSPDAHHDRVRFGWTMYAPDDGRAVISGVDFGILADDGRLEAVTGFLEESGA
jgi:hypothetical protein